MPRSLMLLIGVGIAVGLTGVFAGCAAPTIGTIVAPTEQERRAAAEAGFELSPVRLAADLLTPDQLSGPYHSVGAEVLHDGRANVYSIVSDFGNFEARGDEQLAVRLSEIEALAAMRETSKTATFAAAVGRALTSPFVATWNLVTNPVDSVLGVPLGAWAAIDRTAQLARGERSEFEEKGLVALIGFETHKRLLAAKLDVDPYSSNKALQKQLNRFAWAAYAGSLPSMFVPFVQAETPEQGADDRMSQILREYSPEDLSRLNRIELTVMGISGPLAAEFIGHRWYSPRDETVLVAALAEMDLAANRVVFIEAAISAESEADARVFTRTALLLREYSERASGIRAIVSVDDRLMAYTDDETLVLPFAADHAIWNRSMASLAALAEGPLPGEQTVARTELLVTGTLSQLARRELQALSIEVTERAFDQLGSDTSHLSLSPGQVGDGTQ